MLRPRLLLCLNGLGTNAGLKRIASAQHGASYQDLLYVRRRYVTVEQLREAIAVVTDATLRVRDRLIWGEGTTACASDSKHFGAWDQNLMTEWHVRYGGRGVMIYWHVERKSLCIHSQLKSPSSSEVAGMIEGVLRHCTEMEVDRQYVDSHGQSVVAFAFTSCSASSSCRGSRRSTRNASTGPRPASPAPTPTCSPCCRGRSTGI